MEEVIKFWQRFDHILDKKNHDFFSRSFLKFIFNDFDLLVNITQK